MTRTIWLNNMHASQRDVADLIRRGSKGEVRVVSSHKLYREDIFMTADEHFVEPSSSDDEIFDYAEWAFNRAEEGGWSGMLAMRCRKDLIAIRDRFEAAGIRLAAGAVSAEVIALCDHKDQFTVAMKAAGIPVTETIAVDDVAQLRTAIAEIAATGTDVCIKPAVGVYGRGFWRFRPGLNPFSLFSTLEANEVDPEVYIDAYAKADAPARQIVMQYLPGIESSIDCVCDNGRIVAHAVRQKHGDRQIVFTGGPEVEVARAVAASLGLDGLVNIQTKADAAQTPVLLEVNTRPSGGVGFSSPAGINLPLAAASMLLGDRVPEMTLSDPVVVRRSDITYVLPKATSNLLAEKAQ